jgi:hypothetical protein
MRFALFFLGEYVNMIIVSAMCVDAVPRRVHSARSSSTGTRWRRACRTSPALLVHIGSYLVGPLLILPAKIHVLPLRSSSSRARRCRRMRYDQLMSLGWKRHAAPRPHQPDADGDRRGGGPGGRACRCGFDPDPRKVTLAGEVHPSECRDAGPVRSAADVLIYTPNRKGSNCFERLPRTWRRATAASDPALASSDRHCR